MSKINWGWTYVAAGLWGPSQSSIALLLGQMACATSNCFPQTWVAGQTSLAAWAHPSTWPTRTCVSMCPYPRLLVSYLVTRPWDALLIPCPLSWYNSHPHWPLCCRTSACVVQYLRIRALAAVSGDTGGRDLRAYCPMSATSTRHCCPSGRGSVSFPGPCSSKLQTDTNRCWFFQHACRFWAANSSGWGAEALLDLLLLPACSYSWQMAGHGTTLSSPPASIPAPW